MAPTRFANAQRTAQGTRVVPEPFQIDVGFAKIGTSADLTQLAGAGTGQMLRYSDKYG